MDLILSDLDIALTFMDVADISRIEETKDRNHRNARKAYDTALKLLKSLSPDVTQQAAINAKLALLKSRLTAVNR